MVMDSKEMQDRLEEAQEGVLGIRIPCRRVR